jgi:hypothetical protein
MTEDVVVEEEEIRSAPGLGSTVEGVRKALTARERHYLDPRLSLKTLYRIVMRCVVHHDL